MKIDVHIYISKEKYSLVKKLAERDNRKITAIIDIALDRYLKSKKVGVYEKSKK